MNRIIALLFFIAIAAPSVGQDTLRHSFGLQVSVLKYTQLMSGDVENIHLYLQPHSGTDLKLGLFYNYRLRPGIYVRAEAVFLNEYYAPVAYDKTDTSVFGPLHLTRSTIGNPALTFPVSVSFRLPFAKGVELFGGITPHITLAVTGGDIVNTDPRYRAQYAAMDAIIPAVKSKYAFYQVGIRTVVKNRIELSGRIHRLLSDGFLNPLFVSGKVYDLPSNYTYIDLTVGYRFYGFKKKGFN